MNAKQSELSGGDNPAEQDVLSDPVDFRPPTVPMKTPLNGNITTPNYSAPIDLGPVSGSQNPAIEGSNTQHQEGNVLSLSGDLHQDVQHTPRYDIGTAGVSEGHSQDFSLDRPIDPFVSNSTDASPRRTIELQSNNPFRAKLEQCQSDATPIASSPFPAPQSK